MFLLVVRAVVLQTEDVLHVNIRYAMLYNQQATNQIDCFQYRIQSKRLQCQTEHVPKSDCVHICFVFWGQEMHNVLAMTSVINTNGNPDATFFCPFSGNVNAQKKYMDYFLHGCQNGCLL